MSAFRFLISLSAIILASFIQLANIFILGVKPNLALVLIYILSLINKSWIKRAGLIFASALVLNFYAFDSRIILFIVVAALGIFAIDNLPWTRVINIVMTISLGTIAMNVYNFRLETTALELIFNLAFGAVLFMILDNDIPKQKIRYKL